MLKDIKKFYEKVKLNKATEDISIEVPLSYVHVFHKEYERLPFINLPELDKDGEFETPLELRKSTRQFSDKPLSLKDVSKILGSCRIVDEKRVPEKRTYPSGGARFPVELYLMSYNIEDLESGAYHYNFKKKGLELLLEKNLDNKKRELISPYLDNPAATIIFTSSIPRSEIKYGNRAYPYSLIEAGHMGQNIHLACAEKGIGSCSISGFVDTTVNKLLDLIEDEILLYSISVRWEKI